MKKIFETKFGSHVYGTSRPDSDLDFKGIYIPDPRDILLQRAGKTSINQNTKLDGRVKNTKDDVDVEMFTLQSFIRLCSEGQTVAIDMLFVPQAFWVESCPTWRFVVDNRHRLIHRGVSSFVGYCQTQAAKYGIKGSRLRTMKEAIVFLDDYSDDVRLDEIKETLFLSFDFMDHVAWPRIKGPDGKEEIYWEVCNRKIGMSATVKYAKQVFRRIYDQYGHRARMAETSDGVDWKALYHAVRVCGEAKELLSTGHVTFPRPDASLLLDIRNGLMEYAEVAEWIENGLDELKEAKAQSKLPDQIDLKFWEDFVFDTYRSAVIGDRALD